MSNTIKDILNTYQAITLNEMDSVKLMNRTDTKFVFHSDFIPALLAHLQNKYKVLDVNGNRIGRYNTHYFDTSDHTMFIDHHNGKGNRVKIRRRDYLNDGISFLEIKRKTNKGRTLKKRIPIDGDAIGLNDAGITYLRKRVDYPPEDLSVSIINKFERITLVHHTNPERATIDFNISFTRNKITMEVPYLCIAEIKQDKSSAVSDIKSYLYYDLRLKPQSISKYCLGIMLINKKIKHNAFKEKLIQLQKLEKHGNTFNSTS